ncbi:hypothetical protein A3D80_00350 [Candidatus Roizmanbacteria bacterium RIFCSPHIGHO2_02_FULL_40_13b]|uniref:Glycosyltransferase 2-like domain-containing protein n=1 Tax=Candidatus Roizmanbacteria bacterium RIFCSPHIGHO2_01_FULL_39_24 TaxID=1802032 RepID=A0A1F7GI42_9BACT|nr:MAG: hypothetical protein A2799_03935 [Candidatus Roizmanbacteria bacterium RIFCSPHIGHO2_01_FULL_39_24]OGK26542.1 MAG: hypothetical protein A3D80_00350 [Candidatus Roizmanbacteria bacterium RIFCSPHIGHO2_02_FULL_40_13b]OGK49392.1 MAG: hypothetical protein A3A56_01845 [Candidatus Roizmanbacteria bacterium RIFCSPLOWO2_01_FULL_40_32]OGK56586.1 MAG: hypothetical protein A3H83_03380 [Candidatus Roizmanbacteria bacterium RIFCSPLOWO2_02_FULL_39_8]
MKEISLLIPIYNEEQRLNIPFKKIHSYLEKNFSKKGYEIILINDGSTDKTQELVEMLLKQYKQIQIISYKNNQGKGYALSKGVRVAIGKYVIFLDIDLSVGVREIPKALSFFKKDIDIVIGSRRIKGSKIIIHQPKLRETLGHCYTIFTTSVLDLDITDLTCGFKGFKNAVAKDIFKNPVAHRWSFDAEILYKAYKKGYTVKEIPISWRHVGNSKVNIGFDAIRSFIEVVRIRLLTPGVKRTTIKG